MMKRALSLVGVAALAAALAGCSRRTSYESETLSMPADPFTVSDALGATGGFLLIPFAVAVTLWIVWGFDRYRSPRSEAEKAAARVALIAACGILAVVLVLWVAAVWLAIGN